MPGTEREFTGLEVAALGDVVVVLRRDGGVAFMDGEPVTREMDVQFWFEPWGTGQRIKTAQMTVRRHPKDTA